MRKFVWKKEFTTLNKTNFLKRQYFDSRLGMTVIGPLLAISNFVLLAYNFTVLNEVLPFRIFAPLFIIVFIIGVVIIGKIFRNHQQATDYSLVFEQDVENRKTDLLILEAFAHMYMDKDLKPRLIERLEYIKKLVD